MNEKTKLRNLTLPKVLLTLVLFEIFWCITSFIGWNNFFAGIRDFYGHDLYQAFLRILYSIPFLILIKHYEKDLKFSLKDMFTKFDLKLFSILFSILLALELIMMFIMNKGFHINVENIPLIFDFFLVGLFEEISFRGWTFNALYSKMSYKKANILQTLYFMFAHITPYIPFWIQSGAINMEHVKFVLIWNFPSCLICGILYGYILKKTKSLWIPMLLHAAMDYLSYLFMYNAIYG